MNFEEFAALVDQKIYNWRGLNRGKRPQDVKIFIGYHTHHEITGKLKGAISPEAYNFFHNQNIFGYPVYTVRPRLGNEFFGIEVVIK